MRQPVDHVLHRWKRADYEHFVPEFSNSSGTRKTASAVRHDRLPRLGRRGAVGGHQVRLQTLRGYRTGRDGRDQMWQQGMAAFCEPFTTAAIRYFDHSHADEARKWLVRAEISNWKELHEMMHKSL